MTCFEDELRAILDDHEKNPPPSPGVYGDRMAQARETADRAVFMAFATETAIPILERVRDVLGYRKLPVSCGLNWDNGCLSSSPKIELRVLRRTLTIQGDSHQYWTRIKSPFGSSEGPYGAPLTAQNIADTAVDFVRRTLWWSTRDELRAAENAKKR